MRPDGRRADELRPVEIATGYLKTAEGSALITVGNTQVLCAASVESSDPAFRRNTGKGWVAAEDSRWPRPTARVSACGVAPVALSVRTHQILRLIGRSVRSVIDLSILGERSIILDC